MHKTHSDKCYELIGAKKWTQFLQALPAESESAFVFPDAQSMESCKAVAMRINARGDNPLKFKMQLDYEHRLLVCKPTKRDNG